MLGNWKSSPVITKHGPILTAKDIPYKATLVFTAGVGENVSLIREKVRLQDERQVYYGVQKRLR